MAAASALAGCGDDEPESPPAEAPPATAPAQREAQRERIPVGDGRGGVRLSKLGEFRQPLYLTQPPGERDDLYVVEKEGRVVLVEEGGASRRVFLDLSGEVTTGSEQGLLSLAFAADYHRSRRLYVNYTDRSGDTRIEELRAPADDPRRADPETRRELLRIRQPADNHNGGLLLFGPDRRLYIGSGDGGSAGDPMRNAQDLSNLLGKILRIDPRPRGDRPYSVPGSNPFVDRAGARGEIYSYGLRNPWRFSFDRRTGALSIGDVGQNAFEEVDLVARGAGRGANFGWSAFEGTQRFNEDQEAAEHVPPVLTYPLQGGACAVTGGYVVRDRRLPSLYGRYLYADFCLGRLRSFPARPGREADDDRALGLEVPQLSSFGEDRRGRVYAVSLSGPVYRLAPR